MAAWDEMAVVGRITRPHGLRGDVVISPETDFVDARFVPGATLWMRAGNGTHALKIATARVHGGRAIVGFEGCTRIEDAGFEIRDMIAWVYGSGFPKSLNIGKQVAKDMGENVKIGKAFITAGEYGNRNLRNPEPINNREQFRHIPQTPEAKK